MKIKCLQREHRYLLLMPEYEMGGAEIQFRYVIESAEKNQWNLDVIIEHRFGEKSKLLKNEVVLKKNVRYYELAEHRTSEKSVYLEVLRQVLKNSLRVKYTACLIYSSADLVLVPMFRSLGIHAIFSERIDASNIIKNQLFISCLKYCNCILANSTFAQKRLENLTGKRIILIRNGKPPVQQLPLKENREICRVLVPGRIVASKNQLMILHYLRDFPAFKGQVIFAGIVVDGGYERKLKNFVNRYHLQERVEFLGYVDNLVEQYEKADLVILPSLKEGTPNVVLEAYAYGRPVIVSNIESEKDVVRNDHLRFGLNGTDEINKCIEYIQGLSNKEYTDLIVRNRQFVINNYSIDRMNERFYKVLRRFE